MRSFLTKNSTPYYLLKVGVAFKHVQNLFLDRTERKEDQSHCLRMFPHKNNVCRLGLYTGGGLLVIRSCDLKFHFPFLQNTNTQ